MKKTIFLTILFLLTQIISLFADSRLIKNLDVWDVYQYNFNASHWIEQGNLQSGVSIYGEVNTPIIELPEILKGADFLQTSVSSYNYSGETIVNFTAGEDATLFIAYSVLAKKKPNWLNEFSSTGQFVKTAIGDFEVLSKSVKGGEEISLGDNGTAKVPMYFVALQAKNKIVRALPNGKIFDIKDFGAIGDNKTINTLQIQSAIDKCSASKEGGVVYISDGVYLSGTLELKDNVTLYVEKGAILRGSQNHDDFPQKISNTVPSFRSKEHYQFLFADSRKNIRITGGGIIDGNSIFEGFPWKGKGNEHERPRLIRMIKCKMCQLIASRLCEAPIGPNTTKLVIICRSFIKISVATQAHTIRMQPILADAKMSLCVVSAHWRAMT